MVRIHCSRCRQTLPAEAFAPSQRKPGAWCASCMKAYLKEYHSRTYVPSADRARTCRECGAEFLRWETWKHPGAAATRCHPCYLAYTRRRQTPNRKQARKPTKPGSRGRRWRELRTVVLAEETDCWICGEQVDQTVQFPDPLSPAVDHIIPIAQGGSNDRNNLRLTHMRCNAKAGSRHSIAIERIALLRAALWMGSNFQSGGRPEHSTVTISVPTIFGGRHG